MRPSLYRPFSQAYTLPPAELVTRLSASRVTVAEPHRNRTCFSGHLSLLTLFIFTLGIVWKVSNHPNSGFFHHSALYFLAGRHLAKFDLIGKKPCTAGHSVNFQTILRHLHSTRFVFFCQDKLN